MLDPPGRRYAPLMPMVATGVVLPSELLIWAAVLALPALLVVLIVAARNERRRDEPPD
jgi:hypothetical protein